jgi:hypothetical protein
LTKTHRLHGGRFDIGVDDGDDDDVEDRKSPSNSDEGCKADELYWN